MTRSLLKLDLKRDEHKCVVTQSINMIQVTYSSRQGLGASARELMRMRDADLSDLNISMWACASNDCLIIEIIQHRELAVYYIVVDNPDFDFMSV